MSSDPRISAAKVPVALSSSERAKPRNTLRRLASKLKPSPGRGWGSIPRPGGRSGDARLARRTRFLICICAFISPEVVSAETFGEASKACSSVRGHVHRLDILHKDGWHLVQPNAAVAAMFGDALAISNPPDQNSVAAWEERRTWSRDLVQPLLKNSVSIARKGHTILALGFQRRTEAPTCFLMTDLTEQGDAVLASLERSGDIGPWSYGVSGRYHLDSPNLGELTYHTEVSVFVIDQTTLADLPSPLHPTMTASFVTKPVR